MFIKMKSLPVIVAQISFVLLSASMADAKQPNSKPLNYLILLADDISAATLGCYGALNPHTSPQIDKLASEGIRFTNMFVSEAMCAPARAELYTGLQPERNGCNRNHLPTNKGTKSVVHYLEKLNYRVGLAGKRHFSPASVYPFEGVKGFEPKCATRDPHPDNWEDAEKFMTRDRDEPFCLFICSIHAHAPWDAGDSSLWKLEDLKLPPNLVDTEETRHHYRELIAEVRLFDDQVGKSEQLLKKHGLDENTVIIVLDENGTGMPGGKWSAYDWGVRSGCVMKWPASYKANFSTDAIAQYCDIVPTLIEAAGGAVPETLDGKSLLPLIEKKTDQHRKYAFFSHHNRDTKKGKKVMKDPHFALYGATDGRYKILWNLTPGNMYGTKNINGVDYGDVNHGSSATKIFKSWIAVENSDPKVKTCSTYSLLSRDPTF